ncbi:glycosyltransferase 4-like protein [Peptoanaerobacter stomatis]|uniref:Glycosyltransferase 4-like protein n=1 Tax=Peptoanaerobacter stomatis TaxID=796937 RepID=J6HLQ0_9FIRM|nr:glycosyltransferase 4-like protein [Peptoanaerobacter stomatis]
MKILYFSSVNWNWIKQRPHFIAEGLFKSGYKVDYLSMSPFGKVKIKNKKFENINFRIIELYSIPLHNKFIFSRIVNKFILNSYIDLDSYDIIIVTNPNQYGYIKDIKNKIIIYDCMDNNSLFYDGYVRKMIKLWERKLLYKSDKIIVSSNYLYETIIENYGEQLTNKLFVVRNAVDIDFCNYFDIQEYKSTLKSMKKPCFMYIGTIESWLDFDLLNRLLEKNKDWTLYLVGPYSNKMKRKFVENNDRIIWVGKKEHNQIKYWISCADIMVIPFKINELIKSVDPVKMYEFIAMDKTIISTYWSELEYFSSYDKLHFIDRENIFILEEEDYTENKFFAVNENFINKNNWGIRIKKYEEILNMD